MNKLTLAIALIGAGTTTLSAGTTYALLDAQNKQSNLNAFDNSYISPYSGAFGPNGTDESQDTVAKFFCDDYVDHSSFGSSWTADVTALTSTNSTNSRYGGANENIAYPSGTALYEQIAWLFTQSASTGQTVANQDQIQEAVWLLTAPKNGNVVTSTPENSGANNVNHWISAAQTYYMDTTNSTPNTYVVADYSKWLVVTDANTVGLPSGKIDADGTGNQEFLAYAGSGVPEKGFGVAPEPASLALFAGGLFMVGLIGRRRLSKQQ